MGSEAVDRTRAMALLAAHTAVERARRKASPLREVSWEGPYQLILRTYFETPAAEGEPIDGPPLQQHEEVRTLGARGLPVDVAADLALSEHPGDVVHRVEASRIEELVMPAGYRASVHVARDLGDAAAHLCEHHGVPPGARIVRQVLEVRRIGVAHLRLADGAEVWCWGDPPRLHPADALETFWVRVARARGAIALGLGALAAIVGAVIAAHV